MVNADFLNRLNHLERIARLTTKVKERDESITYALVSRLLLEFEHRYPTRFETFPQLYLRWNPQNRQDRRSTRPDIGFGSLLDSEEPPHISLIGGAEVKPHIAVMRDFLAGAEMGSDPDVLAEFSIARSQAQDQAKCAVKMQYVANDVAIPWLLVVGPYFIIEHFGPFNDAELATRGHRVNDSGDWDIAIFLTAERQAGISAPANVYRIGTQEAFDAVARIFDDYFSQ
ncbi:hypothetical protein HGRIS_014864 [Hohenbuehelia grisea]|uniref:Uncharacterized protein n=1 Tax=Hohenbuehelia grisea TaxID=104357 RepID=A0ABR3IR27_9AGAR